MTVRKYFPANPLPSEAAMLAGYQEANAILATTRVVLFSLTLSRDRLLHLSPSASELYGETVDVLIHHPGFWMEAIHPADQADVWQAFDQFIRRRQAALTLRYRLRASDGEEVMVTHQAVVAHAPNGQRLRIDCVVTPTPPEAKPAITPEPEWFHVAPTPLILLHRDGRLIRVNPAASRLLGEPAERLIGRNWQECFTAERGASANEETLSGRLLTATGEQRWISVRSVEVACGSPGTRLLSLHDIDAPMALAARHQRAHTLLDRTPDLVAHADAAGQLEYLNPHGCTLLGIAPETLPQRFLVDLFPTWAQPHFLHTCLPSAMQSGVWRGELALSGREGRHIPVMLTLIVHKPREGIAGCSGYSLLAHDVSAYKLREQRYKAAKEALEADQLLHASLLTNVSSNLVTPMARLREIVSALERDPARAADLLPLLRQQVQQAGQLVDATTEFLAHGAQRDLPLR